MTGAERRRVLANHHGGGKHRGLCERSHRAPQPPQIPRLAILHIYIAIGRAPCPKGSWEKPGEAYENFLMWPRDHCIDQLAALDKVVQRGVQFV